MFSTYTRLGEHDFGAFSRSFQVQVRVPGSRVKFQITSWHPKPYIRLFSSTSWVDWCEHFSDLTFLSQVTVKNSAKGLKITIVPILSLFLWRICTKRYHFILYLQIRRTKEDFNIKKLKIERLVRAQYRSKAKLENFDFSNFWVRHSNHISFDRAWKTKQLIWRHLWKILIPEGSRQEKSKIVLYVRKFLSRKFPQVGRVKFSVRMKLRPRRTF